ncbi:MAG TPA: ribosome biogenesis GTPase Der [Desulfomonilia bacterium]|nr:ribosome biogenesis GTPase Der [Desulfomonilia bacterium]
MPVVAIVGRPNVGKSTLFNLLIGERRAIVGPQRGITRDRIYGRWTLGEGLEVDLVDTGGFDTIGDIPFSVSVQEQTLLAIEDADLILCLFDAKSPPTPDDRELVNLLRKTEAPVIFIANKIDDPSQRVAAVSLYELGIDEPLVISSLNRTGIQELKDAVSERLVHSDKLPIEAQTDAVRVSILGRPNVGKSLLLNKIIGEDRAIVSPEAGTTRDYVDIAVERSGRKYVFVDTAGIRRKARIDDAIERFSVMRSLKNIDMSHVCLVLVDPQEGITDQDKRLCGIVLEHGRAFVLVVNKCDLVSDVEMKNVRDNIRHSLRFMPDAHLAFISALTGKNVDGLYSLIDSLFIKTTTRVSTGVLNRLMSDITESHSPPMIKHRPLKLYYITQTGIVPPRFQVVVNHPESIPAAYSRFLNHSIKKACGMEGIPVMVSFMGKK